MYESLDIDDYEKRLNVIGKLCAMYAKKTSELHLIEDIKENNSFLGDCRGYPSLLPLHL